MQVWQFRMVIWSGSVVELTGNQLAGGRKYPPLLTTAGGTTRSTKSSGIKAICTRSKSHDTLKTRALGLEASTKSLGPASWIG